MRQLWPFQTDHWWFAGSHNPDNGGGVRRLKIVCWQCRAGSGWSVISSLSQGSIFECYHCYPNMDQGWPMCGVWQAASPYRPASKHRRLQIISAAEIQLAYLSISVWNRRYGGPMSYVTTIFLQLKVTLWFLCLFIVMSNVGERCSSMLHYWEEDNAGGAMRSVRWINTDHNCKVQAPQPLMLYGI